MERHNGFKQRISILVYFNISNKPGLTYLMATQNIDFSIKQSKHFLQQNCTVKLRRRKAVFVGVLRWFYPLYKMADPHRRAQKSFEIDCKLSDIPLTA